MQRPDSTRARLFALYRRLTGSEAHPAVAPLLAMIRWGWVFYRKLTLDRAFIRAGAMAYATLIALVPMLLLVFGVVHAVDADTDMALMETVLFESFLGDIPEVRQVLLPGLQAVDLGALGLVGTGAMLFVAANLYLTAERSYCDIFQVPVVRPLGTRLLNFYFVITAVPLVLAFGILSTAEAAAAYGMTSWTRSVLGFALPTVLLVSALKLFPCTEVRWGPAVLGGLVSGVLLRLGTIVFREYIEIFTAGNPMHVIYGSLALVPVFLVWLYLLWVFVLLGVEIAHVAQSFSSLVEEEFEQLEREHTIIHAPSLADAMDVAASVARRFADGEGPATVTDIANACHQPPRDTKAILDVLESEGLVVRVSEGRAFSMARPPQTIALTEILKAWREHASVGHGSTSPANTEIDAAITRKMGGTLAAAANRWRPAPGPAVAPKKLGPAVSGT